jgi:hypothetical protein
MVNYDRQTKYGAPPPYPDAPHIPVDMVRREDAVPINVPWSHGREEVRRINDKFRQEYAEYLNAAAERAKAAQKS